MSRLGGYLLGGGLSLLMGVAGAYVGYRKGFIDGTLNSQPSVTIDDLNGDGIPDLEIIFNDGQGILSADLNGDCMQDIAVIHDEDDDADDVNVYLGKQCLSSSLEDKIYK